MNTCFRNEIKIGGHGLRYRDRKTSLILITIGGRKFSMVSRAFRLKYHR